MLLQALVLIPMTALALRALGFRRCQAALARLGSMRPASSENQAQRSFEQATLTAQMVKAASRDGVRRGNCLEQSLVLWWLLRRQGIAGELRIGARKMAGRFEAHAWVEFLGSALNDSENVHRHYSAFDKSIVPVHGEPR